MPQCLECEVLQKARYINTLTFTFTFYSGTYHQHSIYSESAGGSELNYGEWAQKEWRKGAEKRGQSGTPDGLRLGFMQLVQLQFSQPRCPGKCRGQLFLKNLRGDELDCRSTKFSLPVAHLLTVNQANVV